MPTPISNRQASLALTEYFPLTGVFPSQGGGSGAGFYLGEIGTFAGNFVPAGASASGQLASINQNLALYSVIGTTYGGNGNTTYGLPNLNGITMVGTGQGPGLDPETTGEKSGSTSTTLHYVQTPANNLNLFGQSQSFDNHQPSLGITYEIALQGVFPSQQGGPASPLDTIGMVMAFAGNYSPAGFAACQGQLLAISQNTALFAILGTAYGGDGHQTFALPDLRGRDIIGASDTNPIGAERRAGQCDPDERTNTRAWRPGDAGRQPPAVAGDGVSDRDARDFPDARRQSGSDNAVSRSDRQLCRNLRPGRLGSLRWQHAADRAEHCLVQCDRQHLWRRRGQDLQASRPP